MCQSRCQKKRQPNNDIAIVMALAEGDSAELLQAELESLSRMARVSIQGKVTSKKISTWLKSTFEGNTILAISPTSDHITQPEDSLDHRQHHHDVDGYLTDSSSISHGDMADTFANGFKRRRSLRRAISLDEMIPTPAIPQPRPASSASVTRHRPLPQPDVQDQSRSHSAMSDPIGLPTPEVSHGELSESSDEGITMRDGRSQSEDQIRSTQLYHGAFPGTEVIGDMSSTGEPVVAPLNWLTESPFIDALVNWIEGPDHPVQQKSPDKDKPNPWLDIPLQFIALLTYPEPDPKNGNKMTLTIVRETAFVRQRRKTLLMLTIYTMIVRYCSFDFFVVVLFASNCAMLFLMKNSGRMNVNMAKRAVRQRVGWAKQWAGGIFRRGNANNNNNADSTGNSRQQSSTNLAYSPSVVDLSQQLQSSPTSNGNTSSMTADPNPLLKKRGLFGKRRTIDNATSSVQTSAVSSIHGAASTIAADAASIISAAPNAAVQKRRFFKRNNHQNSHGEHSNMSYTNISSTAAPSVTSGSVPIPPRNSTSSSVQHSSTTSNTTRSTITNTPLSSSPLAQSQTHTHQPSPRSAFSPSLISFQIDSEKTNGNKSTKSQAIISTPPLLPSALSAHQQHHDDPSSIALPPSIRSTSPPPVSQGSQSTFVPKAITDILTNASSQDRHSTFQLPSGSRSERTSRDMPRRSLSPTAASNQHGRLPLSMPVTTDHYHHLDSDGHEEYDHHGTTNDIDERRGTAVMEKTTVNTTLDAVSSATADAMDL
ncbi:hypothetical protein BGX34_011377 [Mortierella sp. NVP85]|nr:hypothetical protein BGX34_011377 [Mortierella sp. NVP85]